MPRFKAGDKVVRVSGADYPDLGMMKGRTYIVNKIGFDLRLYLVDIRQSFDPDYFILYEGKPKRYPEREYVNA